jgi:hypothetical protein
MAMGVGAADLIEMSRFTDNALPAIEPVAPHVAHS